MTASQTWSMPVLLIVAVCDASKKACNESKSPFMASRCVYGVVENNAKDI